MATSRTRTRIQPSTPGSHSITYHGGWVGTPVYETVALPSPAHSQTTVDSVTKNFRRVVEAGGIVNNPFSSTQVWFNCTGYYLGEGWKALLNGAPDPSKGYDRHEWTNGTAVNWLSPSYAASPVIDNDPYIYQAKLRAQANINKSDVMTYVTVGEWHKTKILHKQVGTALYDIVKGLYQRKPGFTLAAFANGWMTYRYALMPTLYELEGAVKLFNRKISENQRYTARAYGDMQKVTISPQTHYVYDSHGWVYTLKRTCTREVTYRAGILYESTQFGKIMGGLGLTRPISSVYELIKFSWMLDWWVDIGTWLDAMEPNGSSKTLTAWYSMRDRITHGLEFVGMAQTAGTANERLMSKTRTINGISRTMIVDVKSRDPWTPVLPWVPPRGSGLNSFRCLDIVSLVTQKLGIKRTTNADGLRY